MGAIEHIEVPVVGWGNPPPDDYGYPLSKSSVAYSSALVVKTGPGFLYGFTVYSSNVSAQFVQIFDAAALPADGAAPACLFSVAAQSNLPVEWLRGRPFRTGLVICNSTTGPTKTLGAADCYFDVQFV